MKLQVIKKDIKLYKNKTRKAMSESVPGLEGGVRASSIPIICSHLGVQPSCFFFGCFCEYAAEFEAITKSKNWAHMSEMWRLNVSNTQSIQIPVPVHLGPATYSGGSGAGDWRCSIGGCTVYCACEVITGRRTRSGSIEAPDSDGIVEATGAE